jgi:hypothetical protein
VVIKGERFQAAMSSGLIATVGWFSLLIVYCVFKWQKIEAPSIDQAFLLLTGGWVGMLTLAQNRKNQKVEEKADSAQADVDKLKEVAVQNHPESAGDLK